MNAITAAAGGRGTVCGRHDAKRVGRGGGREHRGEHEHRPEEGEKTSHGYCWPATRSLGRSASSTGSSSTTGSGSSSESGTGIEVCRSCLLLGGAVERDQEVVAVRGRVRCDLAVDLLVEHELDQRLAEGLHLEEVALGDRLGDLVGLVVADQVGDAGVRDHDLDGRDAAAVDLREQALADHAAQHAREDGADQLLLDGGEELHHAADRLGGVDGVHRREDEVAGLRGREGGLGSLGVAQLADQDHVGVLAEAAAERLREGGRVEADLALVDDAAVVAVDDLDRVLDRDDVLVPRAVHVVDDRRERRRLSRAGRAGDEDEPAVLLCQAADAGRQREVVEVRAPRGG